MPDRPYVLLSCAASVDGYIDDTSDERLLLSNDEDFDRVDAVRATCDAILVGANTIRADDPSLLVRSQERRDARVAQGLPESPVKVTVTRSGDVDPAARFFMSGEVDKLVYCENSGVTKARDLLADVATVIDAGEPLDLDLLLADLAGRGVRRLMVEGGGEMHTMFLTAGVVDELQLVVAPFFVGDPGAPRFVNAGRFPHGQERPMTLADVQRIGQVVLLTYRLVPSADG
ncbi:MAG TPA: dihydrofolate reductase family protein [Acidimicrobiales bacterium]|nr:dihydrofolate reductase family protein [Acidimicrobiales bacterium]